MLGAAPGAEIAVAHDFDSMAAALEGNISKIKAGVIDPKALGYKAHEARPLADHLTDFHAYLVAKGGTAKHASVSTNRARKVLALARIKRISDLTLSKAQDALAALRKEGLGQETINHHVRAVKAFSKWLWRDNRAREHCLAHLSTASSEADRRRRRRALTPAEALRLIEAAEASRKTVGGMTGPDRARLYSLALGTGFRASELASLTPERFDLTSNPPTATVPAGYTKNGREAVQPLPQNLTDRLAPWLSTLPAGLPIFNLSDRTAEMLRVDLIAAGIEYETASGVCDFHALRGCYISYLVSSGASVKVCQDLARHSTPSLTIGIYAKAALHDIQGALESLPDQNVTITQRSTLAATGTDGRHISNSPSLQFPYGGVGKGRNLSVSGTFEQENMKSNDVLPMVHNSRREWALDISGRDKTDPVNECRRWESNPHRGSPLEDFKSSASAIPPRRRQRFCLRFG